MPTQEEIAAALHRRKIRRDLFPEPNAAYRAYLPERYDAAGEFIGPFTEADERLFLTRERADLNLLAEAYEELMPTPSGVEGKYGVITASKKRFHPGEPVFLLRGTDRLAPQAIRHYSDICRNLSTREFCEAVIDAANAMKKWQLEHPDVVKFPD